MLFLFRFFRHVAFLEHLQHSVGHHESAKYVRRAEHDRDESKSVEERSICGAGDEERAEHHDAVDGVRTRHQRRVKHRRHPRDHLEPDEDRHDENVNSEYELLTHDVAPAKRGFEPLRRSTVGACRIFPPAVTQTALMMSSAKLRLSSPLGARRVTSAATFLAYIWLA